MHIPFYGQLPIVHCPKQNYVQRYFKVKFIADFSLIYLDWISYKFDGFIFVFTASAKQKRSRQEIMAASLDFHFLFQPIPV